MLDGVVESLRGEVRSLFAAVWDRRLMAMLALFALMLGLAAQVPFHYHIEVGQEDGPGSDLPLVSDFYPPEPSVYGDFRWTTERSLVQLPGIGRRPLQLTLMVFPFNDEVAQRGAKQVELWASGRLVGMLPVRQSGLRYHVLLPPPDLSGDQVIELRSATFLPTGDQRSIGIPVDGVTVVSRAGPFFPAGRTSLLWLGAALMGWVVVRRVGVEAQAAQVWLGIAMVLAGIAALLDPPRFAFGAFPALMALGGGLALVLVLDAAASVLLIVGALLAAVALSLRFFGVKLDDLLLGVGPLLVLGGGFRPLVARVYRRVGPPIAPLPWRWLLLLAVLIFTMRYGGKIYPQSMPGDIGFHANRTADVMSGMVLLLSRNRGVDFPYPSALYLLVAPLTLVGVQRNFLLHFGGALLDALSGLLIYVIALCHTSCAQRAVRRALWAAAIYSLSAAGLMTTWWNFSAHIFAQFTHILLLMGLLLVWSREGAGFQRLPVWLMVMGLVVLQSFVYLGHFGFWMNMSLLGAIGLMVLCLAGWRGYGDRGLFWVLLWAFLIAQGIAVALFYSGYSELFWTQIQATASGGLTGLAGRRPADRAVLWQTLWDSGFRTHFGFFPLPLALCGLVVVSQQRRNPRRVVMSVLMGGTFVIGVFFASLPFLTGSTLSTRWLMFSAWAIAVGAATSAEVLWRSSRAGRWVVAAAGGYVVWVTASMWVAALAWRVRPPEPF